MVNALVAALMVVALLLLAVAAPHLPVAALATTLLAKMTVETVIVTMIATAAVTATAQGAPILGKPRNLPGIAPELT